MVRPTFIRPPKQERSAQDIRHVHISMLCRALSVVSKTAIANTIRRGTMKKAGITRSCHVLKVECSTFGL